MKSIKEELQRQETTCHWTDVVKPSVFQIKDLSGRVLFSGSYSMGTAWREAYSIGEHFGHVSFETYFGEVSILQRRNQRQKAENNKLKKEIVTLKKTIKGYENSKPTV